MDFFENRGIWISLRNYDIQDLAMGWDVKAIVDNPDVFGSLYEQHPLTCLSCLDDYYLYLLSIKFICMREVIPLLMQDEHKGIISRLSVEAERVVSIIKTSDVIKFINDRIQDVFNEDLTSYDIQFATLDLIAKFNTGINHDTFAYLCKEKGRQLIDRFDQFEKTFEKYPDLFELIYPTGKLTEIDSFRFEKTLKIWDHILSKTKSNLKTIVEKRIPVLAEDIKKLSEEATVESIIQAEGIIREFHLFLQKRQDPMAYKFGLYAKAAADLLAKHIIERGQLVKYDIPADKIVGNWKTIKEWEVRLLTLTHDFLNEGSGLSCISRLSKKHEGKHPIIDDLRTNIPTDNYYTMSHQQMLSVLAAVGTATLAEIIRDQEALSDYQNLVESAIFLISEKLKYESEQLRQDVKMLFSLAQLVKNKMEQDNDIMHGICYGTSMFVCALSEKLLRLLYIHLAKDDRYIPVNKATMGELLLVSNFYMVDVFGDDHIQNLSFFFQRTYPTNVGENIRNSLAHWTDISTEAMTPFLVVRMLWLFTDILNTILLYCLKDNIERDESNDQL